MEHLYHLCLVFVMLSHLYIAALWSPAGKGLTSLLLFVMFNCVFFTLPPFILSKIYNQISLNQRCPHVKKNWINILGTIFSREWTLLQLCYFLLWRVKKKCSGWWIHWLMTYYQASVFFEMRVFFQPKLLAFIRPLDNYFLYFSYKTYVVGTQKNLLN